MRAELHDFHTSLMQEVAARASARGELTRTILVENLVGRLLDAEEIQDWTPCFFDGRGARRRAIALDGCSQDEFTLDGTLHLLIADLRDEASPCALNTSEIKAAFSRASAFFAEARSGRLLDDRNPDRPDPSTPIADLARFIQEQSGAIKTVRVLLLSNAVLGSRFKQVDRDAIDGVKLELHVWDLHRFHQLAAAGGRELVDIDLTAFVPSGLPALPASIGDTGYSAYLCVVPGRLLADIYEQYGSRLLEGNVRAFLSAQGKVNKGIRLTIRNAPGNFFAFNNGITATATAVDIDKSDGLHRLVRVRDLQIVNGGQTTASLYNARLRDQASLDGIFVQMKLSVLPSEVAEVMIPEISRFANTQNKVSDADLFANHPFHRKVAELSARVWAPPAPGSQQMTHWFYERARAQYQTEQFRLKPAEKREFLIRNPKHQVITKTDLAKFENTWRKQPHIVSRGAQKNFVTYAEAIREEYDQRPTDFNERWLQHVVARAIIFRSTEKLVSSAPWYAGGYRANIVTYGVARFVKLIEDEYPDRVIDLDRIWKTQRVSVAVAKQLVLSAEAAFRVLTSPPPHWSNITEWAKKDQCWQAVAATNTPLLPDLEIDLKLNGEERGDDREARTLAQQDNTISAQVEFVRLAENGYWRRALAWSATRRLLSGVEYGILTTAAQRPGWVPSDAQAKKLMAVVKKLGEEGLL
ncbi:AIPR family protein [Myxococcus faecalis]|uniref:AIPR family protein n=1 Tax=Myxococcus faecalis TaxID=3115646 RepID=UPI003CEA5CF5